MSDKLTEADLDAFSPEEIKGLTRSGALDHLLSPPDPESEAEAAVVEPEPKPVNPDQGARGSSTDKQLTAAQLETMSAEEITQATREGRMADLLT